MHTIELDREAGLSMDMSVAYIGAAVMPHSRVECNKTYLCGSVRKWTMFRVREERQM